jgi:Xaa-Pro dipeptidase
VLPRGGDPPEPPGGLRPRQAGEDANPNPLPPVAGVGPGRSVERAGAARERVLPWLKAEGLRGVVLTRPGPVSWLTGGLPPPVDRSAATDLVWAVLSGESATLITTVVEADRIAEEYQPGKHGFAELVAVPWHDPDAFVRAAADVAGAPASALASDGHPAFGTDSSDDLTALRLALSGAEQDDLRALGADAAAALEDSLKAWSPGERDLDIQARVAAALEARGADAPVLIVGGDDRVRRYRHPMAAGAPVRHLAMAVVVARRGGLHAAATRFASAGPLSPAVASLWYQVRRIEAATLTASRPGHRYGDVLAALDRGYAAEGAAGGWAGHYQGGPIGYAQREFEIAPGQGGSRWPGVRIEPGHAVAWNPSLPGGAKAEDTYLVHADGLERVTTGPGWPTGEGTESIPPRPLVLEVRS